MKIPFNVYDFFAYLSSGLVCGATLDVAIGAGWSFRPDLSPTALALLLVAAYVLGHVIAQVSSVLLEKLLADKFLGPPYQVLMDREAPKRRALVFPGYYRNFPEPTRERVSARAEACGAPTSGEPLYHYAFGVVTRDPAERDRLDVFLNLYGFARNMCIACVIAGTALVWAYAVRELEFPLWLAALTVASAVVLLYRYLKFYRQYTYHLLLVFAAWPERKPSETRTREGDE